MAGCQGSLVRCESDVNASRGQARQQVAEKSKLEKSKELRMLQKASLNCDRLRVYAKVLGMQSENHNKISFLNVLVST